MAEEAKSSSAADRHAKEIVRRRRLEEEELPDGCLVALPGFVYHQVGSKELDEKAWKAIGVDEDPMVAARRAKEEQSVRT